MKANVRFLCLLIVTAFFVSCGGGNGGGGSGGGGNTVGTAPPQTADYMVIGLDPPAGRSSAKANDLNDNGQIVGWSSDPTSALATLWTVDAAGAVTVQDLGALLGGTRSFAHDINNLGQVVGMSDSATGVNRPFVWTANNGMRDLGLPVGFVVGSALSINDAGQIVGSMSDGLGVGFSDSGTYGIWTVDADGNVLDARNLGTLGGIAATAFDNNVHGNVAGDIWFETTGSESNQTGFFWSESGGVIEIGTEEAIGINDLDDVVGVRTLAGTGGYIWNPTGGITEFSGGRATAINNSGQITGLTDSSTSVRAFIWQDGDLQLLPMPDNRISSIGWSINEAGWIVGQSTSDADGIDHANLWIPN
jgi:probable HAF family extracellular repeat protein